MSRRLLETLNGGNRGPLRSWLDARGDEPRICWYPSAHGDFRDMLYFSREYALRHHGALLETPPPDIFLHTDYLPWSGSSLFDAFRSGDPAGHLLYRDDRTEVRIIGGEELPRCELPLDPRIVDFPEKHRLLGRAAFMMLRLRSCVLGDIVAPVVYVVTENAAFCAECMLPSHTTLSHAVHVRFGGGCGGGGKSTGIWMLNVLKRMRCEVLASDEHYHRQSGDERIYERYPELAGYETAAFAADTIGTIPSESWSCYGNVNINRIR